MKDCCERGGLVLDAFCGSGTVLIAAQKTGRRARAIEIDPLYCDTSIILWQSFAKDDAILLATGETFEQVSVRRSSEQSGAGDCETAGTSEDIVLQDQEAPHASQSDDADGHNHNNTYGSPNPKSHSIAKSANNQLNEKNSNFSPWASPITETMERWKEDG